MQKLIALTDYKGRFGSKHFDVPYRSGLDKNMLTKYFGKLEIDVEFREFASIDLVAENFASLPIIYTSSEDIGYHYKGYIEDIICALDQSGAFIMPGYEHLRANNNKVFMEMLRDLRLSPSSPRSRVFGSLKELDNARHLLKYPCVLKESEGASGTGVFLVKSEKELRKKVKGISQSQNLKEDLKDRVRARIHKGYQLESRFRTKFIVQEFIPKLENDWKIYFFGEMVYVFFRPIMKGRGIKASGGGYDNYLYGLEAKIPNGMLDYALDVFTRLKVPHASLDVAFDGKQFHLIEFQTLYFGTAGIPYSKGYFSRSDNEWQFTEEEHETEYVYAQSIHWFLENYYKQ